MTGASRGAGAPGGDLVAPTALERELVRYLTLRRALGYELRAQERILRRFLDFAREEGADHVSTALFERWRASFGRAGRPTWAARLGAVRHFALWLHGLDPAHEVPPRGLIPGGPVRTQPYIYSPEELARIVAEAAALPSPLGLRGLTYATLFGLIAATGLRLCEALALDERDVDHREGVLTIRRGKWGKARLVPLRPEVARRLTSYARERDRLLGRASEAVFIGENGRRVSEHAARAAFAQVGRRIGLRRAEPHKRHGRGPRIHDLRHTFAVRTMIGWHEAGLDPGVEMIRLTTYLGHATVEATYWYIEAVPELMALAAARLEAPPGGDAGDDPPGCGPLQGRLPSRRWRVRR